MKSPYLKEMHERLIHSCERAESLTKGLDTHQLNWKPNQDQWSIAQCLDHTRLGADQLFPPRLVNDTTL